MTGEKTISADFSAQADDYRDGQTIFLIDGSGSMPMSYGGEKNPVMTAVGYAIDVRQKLNPAAAAFFFSHPDRDPVPILLDADENPMTRFPQGPGYLLPAVKAVVAGCEKSSFAKKLHLVIVSDGEISEAGKEREELGNTLLKLAAAGATIDLVMPGIGGKTSFGELMQDVIARAGQKSVAIYMAPSAEDLPEVMARALNTRTGALALLEQAAREAVGGLDKATRVMSPFKFKKNVVE